VGFQSDPALGGNASISREAEHGRRSWMPPGRIAWAAVILGVLGGYGADSLAVQAAACVVGVVGIIGVIVAAIADQKKD